MHFVLAEAGKIQQARWPCDTDCEVTHQGCLQNFGRNNFSLEGINTGHFVDKQISK